jgi:hypothetical protein
LLGGIIWRYVDAGRAQEVDVTVAQGWTLLGLAGVLMSVIGGLIINQFHLLRGYLDARFESVDARFTTVDVRFQGVDGRLDNLDRDVQALTAALFRRD